MGEEGEEGEAVAVEAEAGDDASADRGEQRFVAEGLTRVDVADVDLDDRGGDGGDGISDSDRCVGIATGIQDNAAVVKAHLLQPVHDFALDVTLVNVDGVLRMLLNQFLQILVERTVTIDLRLPFAHEVQVGAVDDVDDHYFLK